MEFKPFEIGDEVWSYDLDFVSFRPILGTVTALSRTGVHTHGIVFPFGRAFHTREEAVEQARKRVQNLLAQIK
jgi:hypothetical protein